MTFGTDAEKEKAVDGAGSEKASIAEFIQKNGQLALGGIGRVN